MLEKCQRQLAICCSGDAAPRVALRKPASGRGSRPLLTISSFPGKKWSQPVWMAFCDSTVQTMSPASLESRLPTGFPWWPLISVHSTRRTSNMAPGQPLPPRN